MATFMTPMEPVATAPVQELLYKLREEVREVKSDKTPLPFKLMQQLQTRPALTFTTACPALSSSVRPPTPQRRQEPLDPEDLASSLDQLVAEAAALGRAHRAGKPQVLTWKKALTPSPRTDVKTGLADWSERPVGGACPHCGRSQVIGTQVANRVQADDKRSSDLAARVAVLEALLEKAAQQAAEAAAVKAELASERSRSEELMQMLAQSQLLAEDLWAALSDQTECLQELSSTSRKAATAALEKEVQVSVEAATREARALLAAQRELSRAQRLHLEEPHLLGDEDPPHEAPEAKPQRQRARLSLSVRRESLRAKKLVEELQDRLQAEGAKLEEAHEELRRRSLSDSQAEIAPDHQEAFLMAEAEHAKEAAEARLSAAELQVARLSEELASRKAQRLEQRRQQKVTDVALCAREGREALAVLAQGAVVSKMCARTSQWQPRFLALSPAPPSAAVSLKWSNDVEGRSLRRATVLNLTEVVRVALGSEQVPEKLRQQKKPWCCFALWTSTRPFYFWADSEVVAQAFVVGLSRLCPLAPMVRCSEVRFYRAMLKLGSTREQRAQTLLRAMRRVTRRQSVLQPATQSAALPSTFEIPGDKLQLAPKGAAAVPAAFPALPVQRAEGLQAHPVSRPAPGEPRPAAATEPVAAAPALLATAPVGVATTQQAAVAPALQAEPVTRPIAAAGSPALQAEPVTRPLGAAAPPQASASAEHGTRPSGAAATPQAAAPQGGGNSTRPTGAAATPQADAPQGGASGTRPAGAAATPQAAPPGGASSTRPTEAAPPAADSAASTGGADSSKGAPRSWEPHATEGQPVVAAPLTLGPPLLAQAQPTGGAAQAGGHRAQSTSGAVPAAGASVAPAATGQQPQSASDWESAQSSPAARISNRAQVVSQPSAGVSKSSVQQAPQGRAGQAITTAVGSSALSVSMSKPPVEAAQGATAQSSRPGASAIASSFGAGAAPRPNAALLSEGASSSSGSSSDGPAKAPASKGAEKKAVGASLHHWEDSDVSSWGEAEESPGLQLPSGQRQLAKE